MVDTICNLKQEQRVRFSDFLPLTLESRLDPECFLTWVVPHVLVNMSTPAMPQSSSGPANQARLKGRTRKCLQECQLPLPLSHGAWQSVPSARDCVPGLEAEQACLGEDPNSEVAGSPEPAVPLHVTHHA